MPTQLDSDPAFPDLEETVAKAKQLAHEASKEDIRQLIGYIDLTTLAGDDTRARVQKLAEKAAQPVPSDPSIKCGAVCIYPARVKDVVDKLNELNEKKVKVASVVGGFPSGQYHLESRLLEIELAVRDGADELDTVLNRAAALDGDWSLVESEVGEMKKVAGHHHLKVILAVGELRTLANVHKASWASINGGADFIKTSTGKESVNATLEYAYVMLSAIKAHFERTGLKVGFKPAGGIRTVAEALEFASLVRLVVGEEWLSQGLFRIGASSLLDNVLKAL